MLERILKLVKEPSTYAGLAGFLGGAGILGMTEDLWLQIFGAIASVAGVIAMFVLERGDEVPTEPTTPPAE